MILQPYRKTYSRLKFTQEKISSAGFSRLAILPSQQEPGRLSINGPHAADLTVFGKICNKANAEISAPNR